MIESLDILDYRHLENVSVRGIRRVNLITGNNRIGKTTLLDYISNSSGQMTNESVLADSPRFLYSLFGDTMDDADFEWLCESVGYVDEDGDANHSYYDMNFGNGVVRVVDIINKLATSSIVILDDIDCGIHYIHFRKLWQFIAEHSKTSNIQVFATTHNIEMIRAFVDVFGDASEAAAFFEMFKRSDRSDVFVQKIPLYSVIDKLNNGGTLRGELSV